MTGTDIAERQQPTAMDQLVAGLRSEKFQAQVALALPSNVAPARFSRIAITALQTNPDIALCDSDTVVRALLRCAQDGLLPDGREAAIVKRRNRKLDIDEAVYQPMIGGFRKIAAEFGWTLRTKAWYGNDEFEYTEQPPTILHRPVRPGADRGPLMGAYAVATHRDGRREIRVMYGDEIAQRAALATTDAVWKKWPAQMAEKTAGRDLFAELSFAEVDRERIKSVLEASQVDPAEATAVLYGGTDPRPALPAAETNPDEASAPDDVEGVGSQQADASTETRKDSAPVDASAPGTHDDEPSLEDDQDELIKAAADQAALFCPPNGQYKHLTLSEILAVGEKGEGWLRWAMRKGEDLTPAEYRFAVWSFARVYARNIFEQVLAEKEAS